MTVPARKPTHAVLLPVRRLHHVFDAGALGLTQQGQQALLLGDALASRCASDGFGAVLDGWRGPLARRNLAFLPFARRLRPDVAWTSKRSQWRWSSCLGSLVVGVGIDVRTTQSPAIREASPVRSAAPLSARRHRHQCVLSRQKSSRFCGLGPASARSVNTKCPTL